MKHVARSLVFTKRDSIRDRISGCGQLWTKSEYAVQDDLCHSKVNNGNNGLFPTNSCFSGAFGASSRFYSSGRKGFSGNLEAEPLSRDWFVQLWRMDDMNKKVQKPKKNARGIRSTEKSGNIYESQPVMELPFARLFRHASQGSAAAGEPVVQQKPFLRQPPLSQAATGFLKPTSSDELKLILLLSRANLVVTRRIEWANLMLGFEQENRYAVVDPAYPESPVGFITEQSNLIFRQLLRTRRPFVAYITDAQGNELFRVRRPFWLINSTIYAEVDGKEIGVVHRRWHLWRRIYDLYLGKAQFAVVENAGFWDWTFTLKDGKGDILAQIDRDWRGIGLELFTDAGQYAIRFGHSNHISRAAAQIEELDIARPLTLSERAVALALAISLDNDYFSRHSGMGMPFFPMMGESSIIDG